MIYSNNSSAAVSAMEAHRLGEYPENEYEAVYCPVCGEEAEQLYYSISCDDIIGCNECVEVKNVC